VHGELREGALVAVRGPRINFPLIASPRYLFIAGGIGITPILPLILRAELDGAEWTLVYGGRHRGSMAFLPELARYGERVRVRPENEVGLLDLDALGQSHKDVLIYCCGPEALLSAVEQWCTQWPKAACTSSASKRHRPPVRAPAALSGWSSSGPASPQESAPGRPSSRWPTRRGARRLLMPGGGVRDVLAGQPDHRVFVLDAGERAAGETVMACVSRSRSPELRLDL
jgi:ferredoxin-NADP reductase